VNDYSTPWRPAYERYAVALWAAIAVLAAASGPFWSLYTPAFHWLAIIAALMALYWVRGARRAERRLAALQGRAIAFCDADALRDAVQQAEGNLWLGWGFDWERAHAQAAHDLMRAGPAQFAAQDPHAIGARWLHGLGEDEHEITVPLSTIEGHMLVVGTTGAGKTRLLDLLITQAVLRGEAAVIIDPKGDRELRDNAARACAMAGRPETFFTFHPAHPERSCRIDPLASFGRHTELASRIAALVPSETGADPFKAFGQMAMTHIIGALLQIDEKPNLVRVRSYLEGGVEQLTAAAVAAHCRRHDPRFDQRALQGAGPGGNAPTRSIIRHYREHVRPVQPDTAVEGIISLYEHEQAHFHKMIASLMPVLSMLTSGTLGELLSPMAGALDDPRPVIRMADLIHAAGVAYIGLDSLSDAMVGSAVGSMLIADLTAVAGARYNYGVNNRPVSVFIDEAAEVINDPFVQLLNKGRGAGLRLTVATQSFADFAARTGSEHKATQVLANLNNVVALRVLDGETQEYLCRSIPKIRLQTLMRTHASSTNAETPITYSGNVGERLIEEEADLVPPALLGTLPNLEYLARLAGGRTVKGRLPILVADTPGPRQCPDQCRDDDAT